MPAFKDLTDQRHGRLVFKRVIKRNPTLWECLCDCGNTAKVLAKDSSKTKSCGCILKEITGARYRKRPFEWLYNRIRKKQEWDSLTYEEFLELTHAKKCRYCGDHIVWAPYRSYGVGLTGIKVDRKDPAKGYTKGNVVACCTRCNRGKSDLFSYEEWLEIGKCIKDMRERREAALVA